MNQEQIELLKQIIVGEIKAALYVHLSKWHPSIDFTTVSAWPNCDKLWDNLRAQDINKSPSPTSPQDMKELEEARKEASDYFNQEVPKEVDVKKELSTLDRNNFKEVSNLVDRIFEDITEVLKVAASSNIISQSDALEGVMKDYMIDLINPDLIRRQMKRKL